MMTMSPCRDHVGALLLGGVHGFFKADAVPVEKPPDRTHPNPHTPLAEQPAKLFPCEIGPLWANLFLLFWISLVPFVIRWMARMSRAAASPASCIVNKT